MARLGLVPVELERWRGFLFVRLAGGGPSVAEMMAPYEAEIAPYRFEALGAIGRVTLRPRAVNWKNVADNYSDGLHINVAHPGLTRLFGQGYGIEAEEHVDRMYGDLLDRPSLQSVRARLSGAAPRGRRICRHRISGAGSISSCGRTLAFDIYPDQVDFMQFLPVSPTETLIREISYAIPDDRRREMQAARYLNWRINRRVNAEDTALIEGVQLGMASAKLHARSARRERGLPEELRAQASPPHPRSDARAPAGAGLEPRPRTDRRRDMPSDTRIDAYIARKADFARPILEHLREAVHAACPDCEETLKWSSPTFMYKGQMLCSMAAFKAHATFGFWKGSLVVGDTDEQRSAMGQFGRLTAIERPALGRDARPADPQGDGADRCRA